MPERLPFNPFNESVLKYKTGLVPEYNRDQKEEIDRHHLRAGVTFLAINNVGAIIDPPNYHAYFSGFLACVTHDLSKVFLPEKIFKESKHPLKAVEYDFMIKTHPQRTLSRLGKNFVNQYTLAAQAILLHHPEEPPEKLISFYQQLSTTQPLTDEFRWVLASLMTADGIAAANEIRYGHQKIRETSFTVHRLGQRLKGQKLDHLVNIPEAVRVGYEAISRLNLSKHPSSFYRDPDHRILALQGLKAGVSSLGG